LIHIKNNLRIAYSIKKYDDDLCISGDILDQWKQDIFSLCQSTSQSIKDIIVVKSHKVKSILPEVCYLKLKLKYGYLTVWMTSLQHISSGSSSQ